MDMIPMSPLLVTAISYPISKCLKKVLAGMWFVHTIRSCSSLPQQLATAATSENPQEKERRRIPKNPALTSEIQELVVFFGGKMHHAIGCWRICWFFILCFFKLLNLNLTISMLALELQIWCKMCKDVSSWLVWYLLLQQRFNPSFTGHNGDKDPEAYKPKCGFQGAKKVYPLVN